MTAPLIIRARQWARSPTGLATRRMVILVVGVQCIRVTLEGLEDRLTRVEGDMGKVTGWVPHDDIATLPDLDKVARGEWVPAPAGPHITDEGPEAAAGEPAEGEPE